MEQPLLRGESSNYEKAAALIDLAKDGVGIPKQILDSSNFQSSARFYFMFTKFNFIWSLSYFALIALNFLEKPQWCERNTAHSCKDREYFFLGQLPYLTAAECLIYEGIALILLIIHTFFPLSYEGSHIYWKSAINQLKAFCLLVLIADMLGFDIQPFRIAPYIRVVLFILSIRELRETIIILAGMLKTYLVNLAFWFLFLSLASLAAYVICEDTIQGETVFTSYGTTLYQMFLLFTTANSPDVWVPAYKSSRWYCLFFILFMLVGVYFVTNLILAVVHESFENELNEQDSEMGHMRRIMLEKAFDLLYTNNVGYLNKDQCIRLFEELKKYWTLPKISNEGLELIFDELKDNHDVKISKDEFAEIGNVIINLKIQKAEVLSCFDDLALCQSSTSKRLKDFVKSHMFEYLVYFVLILNLVVVIIETMLDIEDNSAQKLWQVVEFIFGPIYIIETALKVYSYGFMNYWQDGQNRLDFIITLIIVIGEIITIITFVSPDDALPSISNGEWIRYLFFARMLRLMMFLTTFLPSQVYVTAFFNPIPRLMPYLGIIFCALCIYCSLGVQIFGGIVNAGNPELEATDLVDNDYLLFNFNDYPNGMVTLLNILVTGVWKELMESYKELTGTSWTYLYFISFYLVTVLLLLNLIAALFLDAFLDGIKDKSSKNCDANDKEVEGDEQPRRRSVGTKTRSKRVDALLHRILSAEFCQNQSSDTLNLIKSFCRMNKGKKCAYLQ